MTQAAGEFCVLFSGGTDTTLLAARLLEDPSVRKLHLLTFCNGICVRVDRSRIHAGELARRYGTDRVVHEIIYITEVFHRMRSPLGELVRKYRSTLVFDLCCRLSMETAAIRYALDRGIRAVCDGTNIDQGRLFLERPDYMRASREFYASYGIDYSTPVYAPSGGRMGRRDELVRREFSVGPKILEKLDITCCLFQQPFCLMAFHTFFFTSFLRKVPLLRTFIARHTLSLEDALELRRDREVTARAILEEHRAFELTGEAGAAGPAFGIRERYCSTRLCGKNAVEIAFPRGTAIDVPRLTGLWSALARVTVDGATLRRGDGRLEVVVHPDGRILIEGTRDVEQALDVYRRLGIPEDFFGRAPTSVRETAPEGQSLRT